MMNQNKLNLFYLILSLFVIIFDQATKFSILAFLPKGTIVNILPCLNLVLTFNFGTSFGLLSPQTIQGFYCLIALSISCIIFLFYIFIKTKSSVEKLLCSLIIGGAIGNLLDRFLHRAVVDFIDVYYKIWHWPAFNVADSFISVSMLFLLFFNLFGNKACKKKER